MPGPGSSGVRLRQAVLVARDLDASHERLRDGLGLGEPFRDPAVGMFGLENTVYALGEDFIEIVSPTEEGTAAGRHLDRRGDGGYMVIFQLDDLVGARKRAERLGVRTVWTIDLDDISASHLHPADIGGAIVSIDRPTPPESWRWGGPDWTGSAGVGAPGRLAGVTVRVPDPEEAAARWAEVLGVVPAGPTLRLDHDQHVSFEEGGEGLSQITVELPGGAAEPLPLGSAQVLRLRAQAAGAQEPGVQYKH